MKCEGPAGNRGAFSFEGLKRFQQKVLRFGNAAIAKTWSRSPFQRNGEKP